MSDDTVTLEILTQPARLEEPRRRADGIPRQWLLQTHATTTDADGWEHYAWTVRLHYQGRSMESPWRAGSGHVTIGRRAVGDDARYATPTPPTAADLLESLLLDAQGYDSARSFEDWALEYGYDTDSRKAEELYRQCGRLADELARMLGGRPWQDDSADDPETIARRLAGTLEEATTDAP